MVVMVVEDNPVSARLLEAILHGAGHEVVVAGSRAGALALLEKRADVQLVVCDMELPDGSGLELVKALHTQGGQTRVPVIMCTGANDPATVRAAIGAGCRSYLLKPVNAAKLLERVVACSSVAAST